MKSEIKPILWGLLWKVTSDKLGYTFNFRLHFKREKAEERYNRLKEFE